ncbi:hypothetical protein J4474_01185 [Candidatus Pacearchaeota archaeon]|nr:hypothetical protein [Candidatus Pacearchaeota archaeon]
MSEKKYNVLKIDCELDKGLVKRLESFLPEGSRVFTPKANGCPLRYKLGGKGLTTTGIKIISREILNVIPYEMFEEKGFTRADATSNSKETLDAIGIKFYDYL